MQQHQEDAAERLVGLLGYVKELSQLALKDRRPKLCLEETKLTSKRGTQSTSLGESLVICEGTFRKLEGLCCSQTGKMLCEFGGNSDEWLRLRRPLQECIGDLAAAKMVELGRATYAELFAARQEALRGLGASGRAELVVGVGLIKWRLDDDRVVEHPIIQMPASLELDPSDGSLLLRRAEGCRASVWSFPGVAQARLAVAELEQSARDYGLLNCQHRAPTDREAWAPLLRRAAHCLGAYGEYVDGPPKSAHHRRPESQPRVFNCFVIHCRDAGIDDGALANDIDAMTAQLRSIPLPPALGRLAGPHPETGIYSTAEQDSEEQPALTTPSLWRRLFKLFHSLPDSVAPKTRLPVELYFGLPANEQQKTAAETLESKGFCVLVGPPGTGKSHTIANVICHYVATGRRVLVTSKGEPATEVLRQKLPEGIRELCVSLGGGDSASFRRLERAVEKLADEVAAAPKAKLAAEVAKLRQRLANIDRQLTEVDGREANLAAKYFAAGRGRPAISALLRLDPEHIELLGLPQSATAAQVADAAVAALADYRDRSHRRRHAASPSCARCSMRLRPDFLTDVIVAPETPPPPARVLDELRTLRRECGVAITWERELKSRAAHAWRVERLEREDVRDLAIALRQKTSVEERVRLALLPRVTEPSTARVLVQSLAALSCAIASLESSCALAHNQGAWLVSLVARADDDRLVARARNAAWLADRLTELTPRGLEGVRVPDLLLRTLVARRGREEFRPPSHKLHLAHLAAVILGHDSDFVDEVARRAFPERASRWGWRSWRYLFAPSASHTLQAELDEVKVGTAKPGTPAEWRSVLRRLVLRGIATRLRFEIEAVAALGRHSNRGVGKESCIDLCTDNEERSQSASSPLLDDVGIDDDLALFERARQILVPLRRCCTVLDAARGITELANRAIAAPSPLESASRGAAALEDELSRLRESLQAHSPHVASAEADLTTMLKQLADDGSRSTFRDDTKRSPVAELRAATRELGVGDIDSSIDRWLAARARVRDGCSRLSRLSALRAAARRGLGRVAPAWARLVIESPVKNSESSFHDDDEGTVMAGGGDDSILPRDARRLWAAVAAAIALENDDVRCDVAASDADASVSTRQQPRQLLAQREACVRDLVCAVAKHALRASMSPETSAALVRLVSAVSAASGCPENSVRAARLRADLAAAMADCSKAVPVWIMPSYRIAQCLPAELASFDLVVLDEASQSDASALLALLRGRRLLVVGDHKQVSPTAAFTAEADIAELRERLASTRHRFREQLLPGRSIFDLANTCFADARVALVHHFRLIQSPRVLCLCLQRNEATMIRAMNIG